MPADPKLRGNPYIIPSDLKMSPTEGEGSNRGGMLRVALADGVAADVNIPIVGIAPEDRILAIIEYQQGALVGNEFNAVVDQSAQISQITAGNIQLAVSTSPANGPSRLVIWWLDAK